MGADAAGCEVRCAGENAGCLSKCEALKLDGDAADDDDADFEDLDLDNDADYEDESLDDDSEFED
jgi:hypothetical protein